MAEAIRGFSANTFKYSIGLVKAKELLATAYVPEGKELTLSFETGIALATVAAQLFQSNFAEMGITLKIVKVDLPTFTGNFTEMFRWRNDRISSGGAGGQTIAMPGITSILKVQVRLEDQKAPMQSSTKTTGSMN